MSKRKVAELAQLAGIHPITKGGFFSESFAAGTLQGFLVTAAWGRRGNAAGVVLHIRFKAQSWTGGAEGLGAIAAESQALKEALGKTKVPGNFLKQLELSPDSIQLFWPYTFFAPKPKKVLAVLKALLGLVERFAQPIAKACEVCGTESGAEINLADWIPVSVCTPCRLRQDEDARRLEEEYTHKDSNPLMGTLFAVGTALILALAWGGVAYGTNRIFAWGAILMGVAIAWAMNKGMGKVNLFGRVLTVVLTVASVIVGDYFFVLLAASSHLNEPLNLDLAHRVGQSFLEINYDRGSGYMSLLFGLIGAGSILYSNRPPVFRKHFRPLM